MEIDKQITSAFSEVVNDDINSMILDFVEIILLTNDKLPKEKNIDSDDFLKWLNGAENEARNNNELYSELLKIYDRARIEQKQAYIKFLTTASSKNWQKYAWLLERKYNDLNLQHRIDIGDGKKIIIERAKDETEN